MRFAGIFLVGLAFCNLWAIIRKPRDIITLVNYFTFGVCLSTAIVIMYGGVN